ncbi:MAG: hypothetical protein AB7G93_08865 [Bdellovibrionales bacterium]
MYRVALLLIMFMFTGIQTFAKPNADKKLCRRQFRQMVVQCVQSSEGLTRCDRADAQKECIREARRQKKLCRSGVNVCEDNCEAIYDLAVSTCNLDYDPATCGGSPACEVIVSELRANCISVAVSDLNACTALCPQ